MFSTMLGLLYQRRWVRQWWRSSSEGLYQAGLARHSSMCSCSLSLEEAYTDTHTHIRLLEWEIRNQIMKSWWWKGGWQFFFMLYELVILLHSEARWLVETSAAMWPWSLIKKIHPNFFDPYAHIWTQIRISREQCGMKASEVIKDDWIRAWTVFSYWNFRGALSLKLRPTPKTQKS